MQNLLMIAAIMAFAPSVLLLYFSVRKYTYPAVENPFFRDSTFFMSFFVALIIGVIIFAFYTYLWTSIINVLVFSVVEVLVFVIGFNLKRFVGKSDTVFYGLGFGLGIGCTFAYGFIYYLSNSVQMFGGNLDAMAMFQIFVYALAFIFNLATVGTTVAEGSARYRVMEYALQAMMINVAFMVIMTASFQSSSSVMMWACLAVALVFAVGGFYRISIRRLPGVVRDVLRMNGEKRQVP